MLLPLVYLHKLRRAEVVVRLPHLVQGDHPAELLSRLPFLVDLRHRCNSLRGESVLGLLLHKVVGGIDQQNLPGSLLWLALSQKQYDSGCGGVVEQVLGQEHHPLDGVRFDKSLPDGLLPVRGPRPRTTGDGTRVQDYSRPPALFQGGEHVLHPSPVRRGAGRRA